MQRSADHAFRDERGCVRRATYTIDEAENVPGLRKVFMRSEDSLAKSDAALADQAVQVTTPISLPIAAATLPAEASSS